MTLYKEGSRHTILKLFYNKKHKRDRSVVENVFGILKKKFQELLHKFELSVVFLPNFLLVDVCYVIC
jgi:hypothetical protein